MACSKAWDASMPRDSIPDASLSAVLALYAYADGREIRTRESGPAGSDPVPHSTMLSMRRTAPTRTAKDTRAPLSKRSISSRDSPSAALM